MFAPKHLLALLLLGALSSWSDAGSPLIIHGPCQKNFYYYENYASYKCIDGRKVLQNCVPMNEPNSEAIAINSTLITTHFRSICVQYDSNNVQFMRTHCVDNTEDMPKFMKPGSENDYAKMTIICKFDKTIQTLVRIIKLKKKRKICKHKKDKKVVSDVLYLCKRNAFVPIECQSKDFKGNLMTVPIGKQKADGANYLYSCDRIKAVHKSKKKESALETKIVETIITVTGTSRAVDEVVFRRIKCLHYKDDGISYDEIEVDGQNLILPDGTNIICTNTTGYVQKIYKSANQTTVAVHQKECVDPLNSSNKIQEGGKHTFNGNQYVCVKERSFLQLRLIGCTNSKGGSMKLNQTFGDPLGSEYQTCDAQEGLVTYYDKSCAYNGTKVPSGTYYIIPSDKSLRPRLICKRQNMPSSNSTKSDGNHKVIKNIGIDCVDKKGNPVPINGIDPSFAKSSKEEEDKLVEFCSLPANGGLLEIGKAHAIPCKYLGKNYSFNESFVAGLDSLVCNLNGKVEKKGCFYAPTELQLKLGEVVNLDDETFVRCESNSSGYVLTNKPKMCEKELGDEAPFGSTYEDSTSIKVCSRQTIGPVNGVWMLTHCIFGIMKVRKGECFFAFNNYSKCQEDDQHKPVYAPATYEECAPKREFVGAKVPMKSIGSEDDEDGDYSPEESEPEDEGDDEDNPKDNNKSKAKGNRTIRVTKTKGKNGSEEEEIITTTTRRKKGKKPKSNGNEEEEEDESAEEKSPEKDDEKPSKGPKTKKRKSPKTSKGPMRELEIDLPTEKTPLSEENVDSEESNKPASQEQDDQVEEEIVEEEHIVTKNKGPETQDDEGIEQDKKKPNGGQEDAEEVEETEETISENKVPKKFPKKDEEGSEEMGEPISNVKKGLARLPEKKEGIDTTTDTIGSTSPVSNEDVAKKPGDKILEIPSDSGEHITDVEITQKNKGNSPPSTATDEPSETDEATQETISSSEEKKATTTAAKTASADEEEGQLTSTAPKTPSGRMVEEKKLKSGETDSIPIGENSGSSEKPKDKIPIESSSNEQEVTEHKNTPGQYSISITSSSREKPTENTEKTGISKNGKPEDTTSESSTEEKLPNDSPEGSQEEENTSTPQTNKGRMVEEKKQEPKEEEPENESGEEPKEEEPENESGEEHKKKPSPDSKNSVEGNLGEVEETIVTTKNGKPKNSTIGQEEDEHVPSEEISTEPFEKSTETEHVVVNHINKPSNNTADYGVEAPEENFPEGSSAESTKNGTSRKHPVVTSHNHKEKPGDTTDSTIESPEQEKLSTEPPKEPSEGSSQEEGKTTSGPKIADQKHVKGDDKSLSQEVDSTPDAATKTSISSKRIVREHKKNPVFNSNKSSEEEITQETKTIPSKPKEKPTSTAIDSTEQPGKSKEEPETVESLENAKPTRTTTKSSAEENSVETPTKAGNRRQIVEESTKPSEEQEKSPKEPEDSKETKNAMPGGSRKEEVELTTTSTPPNEEKPAAQDHSGHDDSQPDSSPTSSEKGIVNENPKTNPTTIMPTEEPSEEENLLGATDEESTALKSKQPNRLVTRQGNSREKEIPVLKNMSVNESAIEKDSGEKPTVEETGGESTSDEDKPEKKGKSLVKPVIKGGGPTSSAEDSSSMGHDRKVSNTSQTSLPSDSGDSQENGSSEKAITTTTTSKPSNGQTVVEQGKREPAPSQEDDKKEEHKSNDAGAEDNTATTPHTTKQSYHDITPESTESPQESSSSAIPEIFGHPNGRQIEESSPASKTTKKTVSVREPSSEEPDNLTTSDETSYRKPNSTDTSSTEDTSQEKSTTSNPQEKSEPLKSEETSSTAGSPHHNPDTTDESEEDDDIVSAKPKSNIVSKPVYEEEDDKATTAEPLQKTTTIKDSQEKSRPLNDESTETATTSTTTVEKYDQKPMETTDTSDKEVSEEFEKGTGTTPKTLKRQEDSSEQGTETGSKLPKKDLKSHPESDQEVDSQEKPTSKHPDHDASMPENISESDEQVSPENPTKKPASLEKSEPLANTSPSLHQEISTYTTPAAGSPDGREVEGNIESDGENPHDKEKPLKSEHGSADHYPSSEISTLGKYAKNSTLNPKQESNYMPLSSEDVSQDTTEKPKKEKSTTEGNPQDDSQPLSNESPEMPTTIMYERMTTISPHKDISSNSLETSLEPRHRTIHKSPQLESTPLSDESEETTNISGQRKGVTTDKPKPTGKSVTESEKSKENSRSPNGFDTSGGGENSSTTTIKKDGHGTTMTPEFTANLPLYLTENTTTTTTKPHEENGRANVVEKTTSSPESDSTTDDYGDIDGRLGQGIDDEPLEIGISEDDKPVLKSHTNIDMPISGSQSSEESTSITAQPYTSSQNQEDEETAPSDSHQPSNEDRREKENPEESEEPESREDQSKQIPDKPDDSQEETPSLTMPDSEEGEGKSIEKHPKDQQTSIITDEAEESEIPDTQRQNSVEIAIKQPEKITHKNTHHKPTATAPKISGDSREIVVEKEKKNSEEHPARTPKPHTSGDSNPVGKYKKPKVEVELRKRALKNHVLCKRLN